jgi:hypothetical protein
MDTQVSPHVEIVAPPQVDPQTIEADVTRCFGRLVDLVGFAAANREFDYAGLNDDRTSPDKVAIAELVIEKAVDTLMSESMPPSPYPDFKTVIADPFVIEIDWEQAYACGIKQFYIDADDLCLDRVPVVVIVAREDGEVWRTFVRDLGATSTVAADAPMYRSVDGGLTLEIHGDIG